MLRVLLWGMGKEYNTNINSIKYFETTNQFEVIGVISSENHSFRQLDGYRVYNDTELNLIDYDYIIVMSEKYFKDIQHNLITRKVDKKKIISYKVLLLPGVKFEHYIRLFQNCPTIISNNCWGGIVYNTLGMECISPFKNLFLEDSDYLKLLDNLELYLKNDLIFSSYGRDVHSGAVYPIMKLMDIHIHFNHSTSIEDAVRDWNRRVKKVNYENLFIEMYTESKENAKLFANNKFTKKICFVPFETDNKYMLQLHLQGKQKEFWETVNKNASLGNGSYAYDLVELLLGKYNKRYDENIL